MTAHLTPPNMVQLVAFQLSDKMYALDIMRICEIMTYRAGLPLYHQHMVAAEGICTKERVLPVVDLSVVLGLIAHDNSRHPRHVVVVVVADQIIGLRVDKVVDVIRINHDTISAVGLLGELSPSFVVGVCTFKNQSVALLDIKAVVKTFAESCHDHAS